MSFRIKVDHTRVYQVKEKVNLINMSTRDANNDFSYEFLALTSEELSE